MNQYDFSQLYFLLNLFYVSDSVVIDYNATDPCDRIVFSVLRTGETGLIIPGDNGTCIYEGKKLIAQMSREEWSLFKPYLLIKNVDPYKRIDHCIDIIVVNRSLIRRKFSEAFVRWSRKMYLKLDNIDRKLSIREIGSPTSFKLINSDFALQKLCTLYYDEKQGKVTPYITDLCSN